MVINLYFGKAFHLKPLNTVTVAEMIAAVLTVLTFLLPSIILIQNSSALAPLTQITSADSEGQKILNGIWLGVQPGDTGRTVKFEYRGFDDNDHILELRCSFDGINYLKSNCSSESQESQSTFTGPDGVSRPYYLKTGTALRELTISPNTYNFGVKVLNDNGELSLPVTRTFKILTKITSNNPNPPNSVPPPEIPDYIGKIKVHFDSIYIYDDHDGFGVTSAKCCHGEWTLYAFVQGKPVLLLDDRSINQFDRELIRFAASPTTNYEIVVEIPSKAATPLSIFTLGFEDDIGWPPYLSACRTSDYLGAVAEIFRGPARLWGDRIPYLQSQELFCEDSNSRIGVINEIYPALNWGAGTHTVVSSTKDFTLVYTISVEPLSGGQPKLTQEPSDSTETAKTKLIESLKQSNQPGKFDKFLEGRHPLIPDNAIDDSDNLTNATLISENTTSDSLPARD